MTRQLAHKIGGGARATWRNAEAIEGNLKSAVQVCVSLKSSSLARCSLNR
jgi:hypothetical protein